MPRMLADEYSPMYVGTESETRPQQRPVIKRPTMSIGKFWAATANSFTIHFIKSIQCFSRLRLGRLQYTITHSPFGIFYLYKFSKVKAFVFKQIPPKRITKQKNNIFKQYPKSIVKESSLYLP